LKEFELFNPNGENVLANSKYPLFNFIFNVWKFSKLKIKDNFIYFFYLHCLQNKIPYNFYLIIWNSMVQMFLSRITLPQTRRFQLPHNQIHTTCIGWINHGHQFNNILIPLLNYHTLCGEGLKLFLDKIWSMSPLSCKNLQEKSFLCICFWKWILTWH